MKEKLTSKKITSLRSNVEKKKYDVFKHLGRKSDYQACLTQYSKTIDKTLSELWSLTLYESSVALVAVGGYGRGSLFPNSDIDLLILIPDKLLKRDITNIEKFISVLWDIGLDVGHSVRKVSECVAESKKDVTTQTNLMEARLLKGNSSLFSIFQKRFSETINAKTFCSAKLSELRQRHSRYNDSFQNLEPNLKESPGGLRDLQTILWITQAAGLGTTWEDLQDNGIVSKVERKQLEKHERALSQVRIMLHLRAKRKEDRLLFDFQRLLAEELGFKTTKAKQATEQLMQIVFKAAKSVSLLSSIILQHVKEKLNPAETENLRIIDDEFQIKNGLLEIRSPKVFRVNPRAIFRFFAELQKNPQITGVSATTLRGLWHAKNQINDSFRKDDVNKAAFVTFFRDGVGLTHTLRLMNQYEVLGRYLPEFGKICGQLQHDLFHVYTVDDHILMVVRNLRRFAVPEMSHEFPLCSKLIVSFSKPELLYISGLYHDIAKGRGGDHSELGMVDAGNFCDRHKLKSIDRNLVVWLVEKHLYMSTVAQKQDMTDPAVVRKFVRTVRTQRRLDALYLLTVADIRGTSPKVWNAWKAKLLEDLYTLASSQIGDAKKDKENLIEVKRRNAEIRLLSYAIPKDAHKRFWSILDASYFIRHEESEIVWHARVLNYRPDTSEVIVKARLSPIGDGLQVMVYGKDEKTIFAKICGFFDLAHYSVVEAKVFTTKHGYYLNTFQVLTHDRTDIHYRDMIRFVEFELPVAINKKSLPQAVSGRLSRRLKYFPIKPEVEIRSDENSRYFYLNITCADRPGLLYETSKTLSEHKIDIHNAKINTMGERVEDTLLISGEKLANPRATAAVQRDLIEILEVGD